MTDTHQPQTLAQQRSSRGFLRARRRRGVAVLAVLLGMLAATLGLAFAPPASAAPIYGNWTISMPYVGTLNDSKGGFLDGLVFFDKNPMPTPYNWVKSPDGYYGPGGAIYHSYKTVDSKRCLTHDGDIIAAVTCNWNDYHQWWAVEQVNLGTTYPPNGGLPITKYASLMYPWTAPGKVLTNQDALAVLAPRAGSTGSVAQRLDVRQLIIPA